MRIFSKSLIETIQSKMQTIDFDGCNISIKECNTMIKFLDCCLLQLKNKFLSEELTIEKEIEFFKEIKPEILGLLLYFNKINNIELKCPIGNNETQIAYYDNELKSLTFFFERNLDFHQYYRANSTYLDEYYFVRGNTNYRLSVDSVQYILDPQFSTGYDYKVAKIICNEMLRIYLNKKKINFEKQEIIKKNREKIPNKGLKWTGSKTDLIELGYSLHNGSILSNGNADIKEIMSFLEAAFNIDLGDYYRTYISIKNRKKDRTPFLNKLIENLINRMDSEEN